MTKTALLIGFACVALLAGRPGHATTVLHQSFPDLVQKAEIIAVGTVSTIHAEWDAVREIPYTLVTFTDLDIRKGDQHQTSLTLQFVGGSAPDGAILQIAGVPEFYLGDRLVLFVVGNHHRAVPLVGMWQGAYRVVFDPERDEDVLYTHAMQPLTALPAKRGGVVYDHAVAPLDSPSSVTPLALDTVLQAIDQEVQHD